MKASTSANGHTPVLSSPAGPHFYFVCNYRRDGREHFNFPAQLRSRHPMQCTHVLTRGLLILAASILLLSHPKWEVRWGRRRAAEVARELSQPFARELLIPYAGRDWIISSTTVQEWAAEALGELPESEERPVLNDVRSSSFAKRRYSRGSV
jgi:hypothetical protein